MSAVSSASRLSWADERPLRSAVVVVDSRFGKTRRLAEALARGFRSEGVATDVFSVEDAHQHPLDGYDLVAFGSPSHLLQASPPMRELLGSLRRLPRLREHYAFAFDSRLRHHPGGAAHRIAAALEARGLRLVRVEATGVIEHRPSGGRGKGPGGPEYRLEPGSEEFFEAVGVHVVRKIRGELPEQFG